LRDAVRFHMFAKKHIGLVPQSGRRDAKYFHCGLGLPMKLSMRRLSSPVSIAVALLPSKFDLPKCLTQDVTRHRTPTRCRLLLATRPSYTPP
jgi:hypothetical protein